MINVNVETWKTLILWSMNPFWPILKIGSCQTMCYNVDSVSKISSREKLTFIRLLFGDFDSNSGGDCHQRSYSPQKFTAAPTEKTRWPWSGEVTSVWPSEETHRSQMQPKKQIGGCNMSVCNMCISVYLCALYICCYFRGKKSSFPWWKQPHTSEWLPDSDVHHKTLGGALHTNKQQPKWQRRHQLAKFDFYS